MNQDEDDVAKELVLIAKFITTNYSNISIDEIRLCIDLSLTDKLDVDVRTFNIFSPMYVSRILNAYIQYRRHILQPVSERKQLSDAKKEFEKMPSPEEKLDSMKELISYFYEEYKNKGIVNDYFSTIYLFLRRNKLIVIPKEIIDEALVYGKNMATKHINDFFDNVAVNERPTPEILQKRYSRNYCVQKHFDTNSLETILSKLSINHFIDV